MDDKLPILSAPVERNVMSGRGRGAMSESQVSPSQTSCEGLTGLASQMCYALLYGV